VAEVYAATGNTILIEKFLSGREFCIAVAGPVVSRDGRLLRRSEPFSFAAVERVLSADERIFTSMDFRPITNDRLRTLSRAEDPVVFDALHQLGRDVFLELDLGSLIRLDIRSDADGKLHVLEANPKPDLKAPADGVTSLICAGLADSGMSYDDLILSLLADRLHFLFAHRANVVGHILELVGTRPSISPDVNVVALNAAVEAAQNGIKGTGFATAAAQVRSLTRRLQAISAGRG
jgi:D-alanine-D-alanine ligase